jgi:hypothetical protein
MRLLRRTWEVDENSPDVTIEAMHCSPDGRHVWLCDGDGGLWEVQDGRWERVDVPSSDEAANCIFAGSDGALWLGMNRGGIRHFNGERWTEQLGGDALIMRFHSSREGLFARAYPALYRHDGGRWLPVPLPDDDDEPIDFSAGRDRRLFVAGFDDVFELVGGQFSPLPLGPDHFVRAIAAWDSSDVWLAWDSGRAAHWVAVRSSTSTSRRRSGTRSWITCERSIAEVRHSTIVVLRISSNQSGNSDAWGALSEISARIADQLGGVVIDT